MPRAAENVEKWCRFGQNFFRLASPPHFWARSPFLEKNGPAPPSANFPKIASPPQARGDETMYKALPVSNGALRPMGPCD